MNQSLFCLKIGGSVITDKSVPYHAKKDTIREIAKALKEVKSPLVISHGVGSFAHTSAKRYGGKNGYSDKWGVAKVAHDAAAINSILMDIFIEEKLPVVSFSPRSFLLTENANVKSVFFEPLLETLQQGLIPVIYGDVIWDTEQKSTIYSGETSLNILCRYLQRNDYDVTTIVQLSNVDGVLDGENNVIPLITSKNWPELKKHIKTLTVADVTGGMEHKVLSSLELAKYGIKTLLIRGTDAKALTHFIQGGKVSGTLIQ